jgi:hypothetical protein
VLKGTLIEPARTNLLLRSEEFDNAVWVNSITGTGINPVRTANVAIAPDGTQTADRVFFDQGAGVGSDFSFIRSSEVSVTVQSYTGSIWLKADTVDDIGKQLLIRHAGGAQYGVFTLTADWQRVNRTESAGTIATRRFEIGVRTGSGGNAPQVSALLWGAQLETGSVATSYIKTVDTAITQPADVITATGVSGEIGQTEGFVAVEVDTRALGNTGAGRRLISLNDGTNDNRIEIIKATSDGITYFVVSGTATVVNSTFSSNLSGKLKIIGTFELNNFNLYVNGAKVITDTSATVPPTNTIRFGTSVGGGLLFNDHISQVLIGKTAISDGEAIAWSTL